MTLMDKIKKERKDNRFNELVEKCANKIYKLVELIACSEHSKFGLTIYIDNVDADDLTNKMVVAKAIMEDGNYATVSLISTEEVDNVVGFVLALSKKVKSEGIDLSYFKNPLKTGRLIETTIFLEN